jgi:hypothetical protein
MAVKKTENGKIIDRYTGGTFFDVREVPKFEGLGRKRRVVSSEICLFHAKHKLKSGFKNIAEARNFAVENLSKYNKKKHQFA